MKGVKLGLERGGAGGGGGGEEKNKKGVGG